MDDFIAHYTYDGGNVLAEYAENGDLLRKYLYGPGIDEPISMTEVVDSNASTTITPTDWAASLP